MARPITRLVLVFDANSGRLGAFVDSARKLLMIKGCALCAITHGVTGEREDWSSCKEQIGVPIDYYHRDDLPAGLQGVVGRSFPCVVAYVDDREYVLLLPPSSLEECRGSISELKARIYIRSLANGLELAGGKQ